MYVPLRLPHTAMMMVHTWIDEGARNGHTNTKKEQLAQNVHNIYISLSFFTHHPRSRKKAEKKNVWSLETNSPPLFIFSTRFFFVSDTREKK